MGFRDVNYLCGREADFIKLENRTANNTDYFFFGQNMFGLNIILICIMHVNAGHSHAKYYDERKNERYVWIE